MRRKGEREIKRGGGIKNDLGEREMKIERAGGGGESDEMQEREK